MECWSIGVMEGCKRIRIEDNGNLDFGRVQSIMSQLDSLMVNEVFQDRKISCSSLQYSNTPILQFYQIVKAL
jgi:hypothetical protein